MHPLLPKLREQYREGNLVLFVGAGVSHGLGLPSWHGLVQKLLEHLHTKGKPVAEIEKLIAHEKFIEALTATRNAMGNALFVELVRDALRDTHLDPRQHELGQAIVSLKPRLCGALTTNLDTLLERVLGWTPLSRLTARAAQERGVVLKLHGTLLEAETWVITRDQYDRAMYSDPHHSDTIASFFRTRTLLFVGYGLADDDLDQILARIRAHAGGDPPRHFALMLDQPERDYWQTVREQAGVHVIRYVQHAEVPAMLRWIAAEEQSDSLGMAIDIQSAREASASSPFHWSSKWVPPPVPEATTLADHARLARERAQPGQLAKGCFANRPAYEELHEDFVVFEKDSPATKLPIFLVRGCSGCGKSVALLHLLSRLHTERRHVLWLRNTAQLVRAMADCQTEVGKRVVIGIDGLALGHPDLEEFVTQLWPALSDADPSRVPVLVCTGYAEDASQSLSPDLHLGGFDLEARVGDAELGFMATWFEQRTGAAPNTTPADRLLVLLLYEWNRSGPEGLQDFVRNLRQRIERLGLLPLLAPLLALNQFDIPYPLRVGELPTAEREALLGLVDEGHFHYDQAGLLRCEHPQVARMFFEAAVEGKLSRAECVGAAMHYAFSRAEGAGERLPLIWRLVAGVAGSSRPAQARVDVDPAIAVLAAQNLLQARVSHLGAMSALELSAWIELDGLTSDDGESPFVARAVEILEARQVAEQGFQLLCYKLLKRASRSKSEQVTQQQAHILSGITNLLLGTNSYDWRDWPHVMSAALRDSPLTAHAFRRQLLRRCDDWLGTNATSYFRWGLVLRARLLTPELSDWLHKRAQRWLAESRHQIGLREWAWYWMRIFAGKYGSEEARSAAKDWLAGVSPVPGSPFWSVENAAKKPTCAFDALVIVWLDTVSTLDSCWTNLWIATWNRPRLEKEQRARVHQLGMRKLSQFDTDDGWGYVFEELWNAQPGDRQLVALGRAWLQRVEWSNKGWQYVWTRLWRHRRDNELADLAIAWLRDQHEHHSWFSLWMVLYNAKYAGPELRNVAIPWLERMSEARAASDRPEKWLTVWFKIFNEHEKEDSILRLGEKVLEHSYAGLYESWGKAWFEVYRKLEKAEPDRAAKLVVCGERWLRAVRKDEALWERLWDRNATSANGWGRVCVIVLAHLSAEASSDLFLMGAEALEIPIQHLAGDAAVRDWPALWLRFWEAAKRGDGSASLAARGTEWLLRVGNIRTRDWAHVFGQLDGPSQALQRALVWLSEQSPRGVPWGSVANKLMAARLLDAENLRKVVTWLELEIERPTNNTWGYVWKGLWDVVTDDAQASPGLTKAQLYRLGTRWLRMSRPKSVWGLVWLTLWDFASSDELETFGHRWIALPDAEERDTYAAVSERLGALPALSNDRRTTV